MAFFLTPRFAPAYQQCGPFACAPARPSYRVSRPAPRPAFPSFVPFLSQLDELIGEIERESRREAHQQRQQRKRTIRARFDVRENKEGYEVAGEVPGFEQENISIEVTDEHTLKIAGSTEQKAQEQQAPAATEPAVAALPTTTETDNEKMDGVTLNEPEADAHSDTDSHKSYQPTVEDDFEDLGAETSSLVSSSSTSTVAGEGKGKERAVEAPADQKIEIDVEQARPQEAAQQQPENREWLSERVHGSFERTFQFPERIDAANVRAELRNGVLAIHVPKAAAPAVRQILIQ